MKYTYLIMSTIYNFLVLCTGVIITEDFPQHGFFFFFFFNGCQIWGGKILK